MSLFRDETISHPCGCGTDPNDGILDCPHCFGFGVIRLAVEFREGIGVLIFGIRGRVYDQTGLEPEYISDHGLIYEAQWVVGRSL